MPVIDDAASAETGLAGTSRMAPGSRACAEAAGNGAATDRDAVIAAPTPMSGSSTDLAAQETPAATLARLRGEANRMKSDRKWLMKNLRNAKRVNQRLKLKAKKLSDSELLQIVAMRSGVAVVMVPPGTNGRGSSGGASSSKEQAPTARAAANPVDGEQDIGHDDEEPAGDQHASNAIDMQRLASRMEL